MDEVSGGIQRDAHHEIEACFGRRFAEKLGGRLFHLAENDRGQLLRRAEFVAQSDPGVATVGLFDGERSDLLEAADLFGVENLVPESVIMRVGGFGKVPARFDLKTKTVTWKINRRLRQPTCDVSVQWRVADNKRHEAPMSWTFLIDREAIYQIGGGQ